MSEPLKALFGVGEGTPSAGEGIVYELECKYDKLHGRLRNSFLYLLLGGPTLRFDSNNGKCDSSFEDFCTATIYVGIGLEGSDGNRHMSHLDKAHKAYKQVDFSKIP